MRHLLLMSTVTMARKPAPTASASAVAKHNHHHNHVNSQPCPSSQSQSQCRHSPSATLDLLIFILVLFSGTFLIISYCSYLFQSISLLLPPLSTIFASLSHQNPHLHPQFVFLSFLVGIVVVLVVGFEICCGYRSRRCGKSGCKGLKKAMEFDLQMQGEELLKKKSTTTDVDELPWKGGSEDNPDYECLRAELRKMAPPNGRAVLLFRAKCGCPIAKLVGWGPKRSSRRHKKGLSLTGKGGDHQY